MPSNMEAISSNITTATNDHPSQTSDSTAHHAQTHENQTSADGPRRKSTDSDLMTWAHLSVDISGAKLRTICTQDHEDGETCSRTVREHRYRNISRVDGPSEKITVEGVKAMMESDARAGRESDGEGEGEEEWVVIDRD